MPSPFVEIEVETPTGLRTVKVTNPDKVYFSARGETKMDLVQYYLSVGPGIVNALRERPTVLKRHPDGAEGEAIYQKRAPEHRPPWIETARVTFPSGRHADELCPVDVAHIAWAANLGTLDFHPWPSRRNDTEHPDELRVDLDPMPGATFEMVRECAREVHALFDELGYVSWPKTTGSKGLHVYVRIRPEWSFLDCRHAALAVAREVEKRRPDIATASWWKEERGERVFLDFNRMARDQTIASAYSVRAKREATVSAPVTWDEVESVTNADFTIATMPARFAEVGDPHAGMDDAPMGLEPLLELYERHDAGDAPYPPQFPKMAGEPKRVQPSRARPDT
ncbi:MAG TPA: non-homologous end-joining DNA ligase [Frankiaceae bacterium]|nr:non-homologous end-joining DNA ligase [Frankiaceae bacterium]